MQRDRIDFVGIGAPKCGTTWITECLAEHPEVGMAADKEVYYFSDSVARTYAQAGFNFFDRGEAWYHAQMPVDPGAKVFGEYSVSYMYDPRVAQRIYQYNPAIKILVTLRDPVEMVYSWYWYNRTALIARLPDSFAEAMQIDAFRDLGLYHRYLSRFFERFDRNQIHVMLHDDIKSDAAAVLQRLHRFLAVDDSFLPEKINQRINAARGTRFRWLQRFGGATYNSLKRVPIVDRAVTSRPFEKAVLAVYRRVNQVKLDYPPIEADIRNELSDYYRDDTQRLSELLDRELHWGLRLR